MGNKSCGTLPDDDDNDVNVYIKIYLDLLKYDPKTYLTEYTNALKGKSNNRYKAVTQLRDRFLDELDSDTKIKDFLPYSIQVLKNDLNRRISYNESALPDFEFLLNGVDINRLRNARDDLNSNGWTMSSYISFLGRTYKMDNNERQLQLKTVQKFINNIWKDSAKITSEEFIEYVNLFI